MAVRIHVPSDEPALIEFLTFHDEIYAARGARWTAPVRLPDADPPHAKRPLTMPRAHGGEFH
jgi:hypothetical protein